MSLHGQKGQELVSVHLWLASFANWKRCVNYLLCNPPFVHFPPQELVDGKAKGAWSPEITMKLETLPGPQLARLQLAFKKAFTNALAKFKKHFDRHPAKGIWEDCAVFNPFAPRHAASTFLDLSHW